ncbi:hypothetical protein VTI74DRAFT_825 [Chaetomium olivicolor]
MPVKQITTELGHSLPPEAPHNITFHIPGWDTAKALRRGDPELLGKLSSIYPRFGPWCEVRHLSTLLHTLLNLPSTHGLLLYPHPSAPSLTQSYSRSPFRKPEHRIPPAQLLFRAVDIPLTLPLASEPDSSGSFSSDEEGHGGERRVVRLYTVAYPLASAPGAVGVWQNLGIGISSRLAAALIPGVERGEARVVDWRADGRDDVSEDKVPRLLERERGLLPLGEAHRGLRRRIAGLVGRGGKVDEGDVWLYPTGMAAVFRLHQALVEVRGGGRVVVLGSVFHNSFHLFEESEGGMKHFGRVEEDGMMEELEGWLEGERDGGRRVAYMFAEFPSNPILASVDLRRLRKIADKFDIPVVIDDTIGSFCNIDVSPVADVIITSITKSLSGYANVMGGSVTLLPSSPHHLSLKTALAANFQNEYFHPDAHKLLSNSQSYLARSAILNRNALTLATYLHQQSQKATSPLTRILYPPFTKTLSNYQSLMLSPYPTEEGEEDGKKKTFHPGYGCLLSLEFTTLRVARAFYDNLSVYHGPHLGAHHTLAFPFNDAIWGTDPEAAAYLATYGARAEQVRVSVGLEDEEELIDTFKAALEVAERVKREEEEEEEEQKAKVGKSWS